MAAIIKSILFSLLLFCSIIFEVVDGFKWILVPDKHINRKHGNVITITWNYELERNERFLSSDIDSFEVNKPGKPMALRTKEELSYEKYQKDDASFSVFGKNKVTLIVHSAEIGQQTIYCLVVRWKSEAGINKSSYCSEVSLYDVPRITYHTPQLSCKQGDSIKLKCNATGIPKPHVSWLHEETKSLIDNSSDLELNITSKRSEGRYCCVADNGFGKATACTFVNVTEYEPVNTTLLVNQTNRDNVNMIHIKCKAVASPPSNFYMISINDEKYNSSNGTFKVPAPRNDKMKNIAVSCIPYNMYGRGPIKKIVFPSYAAPKFIDPLPTQYNMTVSGITLECKASGTPTPNITWTRGDTGDIVGTGESYHVSYDKRARNTMTFFCTARNAMGNMSSPAIRVKAMTTSNSSTADDGLDPGLIAAIVVCCIIFIVIFIIVFICRRRKKLSQKAVGFSKYPYQEPIDSDVPGRSDATDTQADYASVPSEL